MSPKAELTADSTLILPTIPDILSASGGKGINNPILVITAGGRVDVDLRAIGDTRAACNIEGAGRCGQRTDRVSCHT